MTSTLNFTQLVLSAQVLQQKHCTKRTCNSKKLNSKFKTQPLKNFNPGLHFKNVKAQSKFFISSSLAQDLSTDTEIHLDEIERDDTAEIPSSQKFDWKSNWYAVHFVSDMDASKPHAVTILGRNMVVWRDSSQTWRCFLDECPHRLVPLSEGRIDEKGDLQCSYHGWQFSGKGNCVSIPQAKLEGSESKAINSPRACAKSFPTTVLQGLLFIWPDENGWEASSLKSPPIVSNLDEEVYRFSGVVRDLNYGYEMLAENVTDPSHLPFSHHGVGRLDRSSAKPLGLKITKQNGILGFEGFSKEDVMPSKALRTEFKAPSLFVYDRHFSMGKKDIHIMFNLYITPTSPGKSRIIIHTVTNSKPPKFLPQPPNFVRHFLQMDVLDGDAFFLHAQEKTLLSKEFTTDSWKKNYYLPTSADTYTTAFRLWLSKYSGGVVTWPEGTNSHLSSERGRKNDILDRYEGHTKHCSTCLDGLEKTKTVQRSLVYAAGLSLLTAALIRAPLWVRVSFGLAAAGSVSMYFGLEKFMQQFYYVDYDHSKK